MARENPDATGEELRRLINAAYPFGERKYHPYKIWLDAVKEYVGLKSKQEGQPKQAALDLGTSDLPLFDVTEE